MSVLYFLIFVGFVAGGLICLVLRSGGKNCADTKSSKAAPHHLRTSGHHPLLHGHANMHLNNRRDIWQPRRAHATDEHLSETRWSGQTFSARKIEFDDELEAEQDATGVTMPTIKYQPPESGLPKTSAAKR